MSLSNPVLTGPGGGRTVESGHSSSAELKIAGEQSGGEWAVVEWRVRAGDEPPIHTHTREDETIYVLDGAITAFVARLLDRTIMRSTSSCAGTRSPTRRYIVLSESSIGATENGDPSTIDAN